MTLKERLFQITGVWEGTYTHLSPSGHVLDHYASRQETRLEGDRWYERIIYRWPDGRQQTLDFRAGFVGDHLRFDDPDFSGETVIVNEDILVFPYYWKDWPNVHIVETIVLASTDYRSRLWQTFENNELVKLTVIVERRVAGEPEIWY
ncbi:MAG: DUF3598 family protein [Acidobacteria bacterium]|nr:DUF3598 family protein [Acidobacteriota bacterium]